MFSRIQLKNEFVSADNRQKDSTIVLFDTNGDFVTSFTLDSEENIRFAGRILTKLFLDSNVNAKIICETFSQYFFDIRAIIPGADFSDLYNRYGREFVNRIGDHALIIRE